MSQTAIAAHSVLILTAVTLLYAAVKDLKEYRIRNELVCVLVGLFIIHAVASGRWVTVYWNLTTALAMLLVALYFYSRNMMGGGDVKMLTVAYLWAGTDCALPLAIMTLVFTIVHTLVIKIIAKSGWIVDDRVDGRMRIPLAPSVATALIGTFLLGCLEG